MTYPRPAVSDIVILILLATVLRIAFLGKESLWLDEAFSVWYASTGSLESLMVSELDPNYPPLHHLLLHFWIKLFGTDEAAVRSLSVIPGVASVVLTYLLGARLFDRQVAFIAGFYVAISTFHIYYSQEARAYAIFLALVLSSTLSLQVALEWENKKTVWVPWVCYLVATVGSLYTHYFAVFFVFAQNVFVFLRWKEHRAQRLPWIFVQTAVLLVFLPWLIQMLSVAATGAGLSLARYFYLKFPQALFSFLVGDTLIPLDAAAVKDVKGTITNYWYLLLAAMAGFAFFFLYSLKNLRSRLEGSLLCGVMLVVPMVTSFVVSYRIMIFDERRLIAVSPFLYLILALGIQRVFFEKSTKPRAGFRTMRIIASVLVVAVLSISLFNYYFHPRFGREQWREVVPYIESNLKAGDIVVFELGIIAVCYEYYRNVPFEKALLTETVLEETSPKWAEVVSRISNYQRIWLVRSHVPNDELLSKLQQLFAQRNKKTFPKAAGIDVYLLETAQYGSKS